MKKLFILWMILACAAGISAKRVAPYEGSRIFWDMRSQQQLFDDGWYARMIQLQDGRLLAASESGWNVIISYSDDMGKTWSPQETEIPSITEGADMAPGQGWQTALGELPDGCVSAAEYFQNGLYKTFVDVTVGEDGIGIEVKAPLTPGIYIRGGRKFIIR